MEKFYILHYIELRRCFVFNVDSNYIWPVLCVGLVS